MIKSYNQQIICEPYKGSRGIKSKISSGMATIQQKTDVVGLKVLKDAIIKDDLVIKSGDTVFIKEEILHTYKEYSQELDCKSIGKAFILMNFAHVAFIENK